MAALLNATTLLNTTFPAGSVIQFYDIICNIIGLLLISSVGIVTNIFTLLVIRKYKSLWTPCFILICGACVCSLFIAFGFLLNGIQEALLVTGLIHPGRMRIACFVSRAFFGVLGIQADALITTFIGLDRLMGMICPMTYRNIGTRYTYVVLVFCFLYAIASSIGGLFSAPENMTNLVQCTTFFSGFASPYQVYYRAFNLPVCILCLSLYSSMWITFRWRKRRANFSNPADRAFMKQQLAALPTVKLIIVVYTLTSILPEISLLIRSMWVVTSAYLARTYYYASIIKCCSCLTEFIGLIFGSHQFRKYAKAFLHMKENANWTGAIRSGNPPSHQEHLDRGNRVGQS